jgi:hypothetical protein
MTNASGKQTYDIFMSYRTTHTDWVETLAHNLKAQGYSIFLDRWELIPGQHFPGAIAQALKNSRCAILVASPDASDSGWVQQELQLMINLQPFLSPVCARWGSQWFPPVVPRSGKRSASMSSLHALHGKRLDWKRMERR